MDNLSFHRFGHSVRVNVMRELAHPVYTLWYRWLGTIKWREINKYLAFMIIMASEFLIKHLLIANEAPIR